jgi:hypothetical protein
MAKKITLNELGDMLAHVVKHMATKEDIAAIKRDMATKEQLAALHTQVISIETELKHGRYETRLGNLETKVFGEARA